MFMRLFRPLCSPRSAIREFPRLVFEQLACRHLAAQLMQRRGRSPSWAHRIAPKPFSGFEELERRLLLSATINGVTSTFGEETRFLTDERLPAILNTYKANISGTPEPSKVVFQLGAATHEDTDSDGGWSAEFDMSTLSPTTSQLVIRAYDGETEVDKFEQSLSVIALPAWMQNEDQVSFDASFTASTGYTFDVDMAHYEQSIYTPDDWTFTVPGYQEALLDLANLRTGFEIGSRFQLVSSPNGQVSASSYEFGFEGWYLDQPIFDLWLSAGTEGTLGEFKWEQDEVRVEGSIDYGIGVAPAFDRSLQFTGAAFTAWVDPALSIELPLGSARVPLLKMPGVVDAVFDASAEASLESAKQEGDRMLQLTATASDGALDVRSVLQPSLVAALTGSAGLDALLGAARGELQLVGTLEQALIGTYDDRAWSGSAPGSLTLDLSAEYKTGWGLGPAGSTDLFSWEIASWDFLTGSGDSPAADHKAGGPRLPVLVHEEEPYKELRWKPGEADIFRLYPMEETAGQNQIHVTPHNSPLDLVIYDPDGEPVEILSVEENSEDGRRTYTFGRIGPGAYEVHVLGPDGRPLHQPIDYDLQFELSESQIADRIWLGHVSNDWAIADNWGGGGVPTADNNVLIAAGLAEIRSGTRARMDRSKILNATLRAVGGQVAASHLINSGTITLDSTESSNQNVVLEVTEGTLSNTSTGVINVEPGAGGSRTIDASLVNQGVVNINASTSIGDSGATHVNSGRIWLGDATGTILGQSFTNATNGILAGTGSLSVRATTLTNNGRFQPGGDEIGVLRVFGDYRQSSRGVLDVQLAGTTPGTEHDQLDVMGEVFIDGQIRTRLVEGFSPASSDNFIIVSNDESDGVLGVPSAVALSGDVPFFIDFEAGDGNDVALAYPEVRELALDNPATGVLARGETAFYRINAPSGETLRIAVEGSAGEAAYDLHIQQGAIPSRREFDFRSHGSLDARPTVLVPETAEGTYFVLLTGQSVPSNSTGYTITADLLPFQILGVGHNEFGNTGTATVDIIGARFTDQTEFALLNPDESETSPSSVAFADATRVLALFDFTGLDPGPYSIVARHPDGRTSTLADAIDVLPNGTGEFWASVEATSMVRVGRDIQLTIEYGNQGTVDVPAPLLTLSGPEDSPFRFSVDGPAVESPMRVFAASGQGPSGRLMPGESVQLTVYAEAPATGGEFTYELGVAETEGRPFDWERIAADAMPEGAVPEEWEHVVSTARSVIGESWNDILTIIREASGNSGQIHDFDEALLYTLMLHGQRLAGPATPADIQSKATTSTLGATETGDAEGESSKSNCPWEVCIYPVGDRHPDPARSVIITHGWKGIVEWDDNDCDNVMVEDHGHRFFDLACTVKESFDDTNVYVVDWTLGANSGDKDPWGASLSIKSSAKAAAELLEAYGIKGTHITLIGESFGNYVNHFIARQLGGVNNLISMNAAWELGLSRQDSEGLPPEAFDLHSEWPPDLTTYSDESWAFYTSSPWDTKRKIAELNVPLEQLLDPIPEGWSALHKSGIPWLTEIINQDHWVWKALLFGDVPAPPKDSPRPEFPEAPTRHTWLYEEFSPDSTPISQSSVRVIQAIDPNDILGPDGFGDARYVSAGRALPYTIRFENAENATAAAQVVHVTQQLDADLDYRSFRLGAMGFGDVVINVPPNQSFYSDTLDLREALGLFLEVEAGIDLSSGEASWTFTAIDPETGRLPDLEGFLPPNLVPPEGDGFLNYTIRPRGSSASGTRIDATATITFDTEEPIDAPPVFNTVDATPPTSIVVSLPAESSSTEFVVSWSGSDEVNGSGIATYDIFVSENDGPLLPWLVQTTDTSAVFIGEDGETYGFASVATDNVGHRQAGPAVRDPDTTTRIVLRRWQNPRVPADVNDDGDVTALDALMIINYLNRHGSGPLPIPETTPQVFVDVVGNDSVAPLDALLVINALNRLSRPTGEGELGGDQLSPGLAGGSTGEEADTSVNPSRLPGAHKIGEFATPIILPVRSVDSQELSFSERDRLHRPLAADEVEPLGTEHFLREYLGAKVGSGESDDQIKRAAAREDQPVSELESTLSDIAEDVLIAWKS